MATETLTCPECAEQGITREFGRPQALGSHRKQAHGVEGKSQKTQQRQAQRQRGDRANERRPLPRGAEPPAAPERMGMATNGRVDRDQLLQTIFPEGLPPREDVIKGATDWLDEAERLAMPVRR